MAENDDQTPEEGLEGAHSRADPGSDRRAPAGTRNSPGDRGAADSLAASVAAIAEQLTRPDGDQLDLLSGSPDLDDQSTGLAKIANIAASERRGRGRPAGSPNKRNTQVFDLLEQLGHRDPIVTLSLIQTADTMAIAKELGSPVFNDKGKLIMSPKLDADGKLIRDDAGEIILFPVYEPADPIKILAIQRQAAADLTPYKYAKRPTTIEVQDGEGKRPFVAIGELNVTQINNGDGVMALDGAKKPNEIKDSSVRQQDGKSHETINDNDINTIDHKNN